MAYGPSLELAGSESPLISGMAPFISMTQGEQGFCCSKKHVEG